MTTAVLDHLWQSTLFALLAALLVAAFRKAPARVRHGLWLAASVKFLIPFAALAALGRRLGPAIRIPNSDAHAAAFIARAAQPFSPPVSLERSPLPPVAPAQIPAPEAFAHPAATAAMVHAAPRLDLSLVLLAVWLLGSAAMLLIWARRWARLRRVVRSAKPVGWAAPMLVLAAPSLLEPGLVGLWRPVLLLPETLPDHLRRSEIDAILAHEICHLRRRDNLTAAIHMLVEALFWFHPLVWWIGTRLIEERERACDEAVVKAGHDRAAYARSLVESCRLYLQSPLDCVAGASGSRLKARVEAIMTAPPASPVSRAGKAPLLAAAAFAFATPVAAGLLTTPQGRKAVARAVALASQAVPVRIAPPNEQAPGADPAPDEVPAAKPVVLAQNDPVLAPGPSVARLDPAAAPLVQDVAAPALPVRTVAAVSFPIDPEVPPPTLAASTDRPHGDRAQVAAFVQSFANTLWNNDPICIRVEGLSADKNAYVKARVDADARAAGVSVFRSECRFFYHVEIRFAADAERAVRDTYGYKYLMWPFPLERPTGSRPIRAWYELTWDNAGAPDDSRPQTYGRLRNRTKLGLAIVVVDPARTRNLSLDTVSDYVAMLALSQPRALDRCNVLPSITDLFAGPCPGRPAPTGLTAADAAYLKALYTGSAGIRGTRSQSELIDEVAKRLGDAGGAAPQAEAPIRPSHPASLREPATAAAFPLLQQISLSSSDISGQVRDFVQTNARVSQFGWTVRWQDPLCVRVLGLTPEQNAAVVSRIDAVAQALSQRVYSGLHQQCPYKNVSILFTADPQGLLDSMIARDPRFLGDAHSHTRGIKTVTRPIQAWRETTCAWTVCEPEPFPEPPIEATVLVDARGLHGAKLGAIADYLAMLVLADPRNLDHCQALPSVLDLFAGPCQGRSLPTGLTRSDLAYLKALYTAGEPITHRDWGFAQHGGSVDQITGRMNALLAGSGSLPAPGAKPERRD